MADRQSQSVATDSQPVEPSLGVFYYVQRVDESWHVAEVIQKRENLETKEQEFYVHYKECEYIYGSTCKLYGIAMCFISMLHAVNRRMDEWVSLSRIDVKRGPVEEGPKEVDYMLDSLNGRERKVTRNLKRKHDEINHVQKVRY